MAIRRGARGKERSAGSSDVSHSRRGGEKSYFDRSKQPLEILGLIAPLVLLYEIWLLFFFHGSEGTLTNAAHESLLRFFSNFGVDPSRLNLPTLALPAVSLIVVMIVWQILVRKPWSIHLPTVAGMAIESALFALSLLVLAQLISRGFVPALPDSISQLSPFGKVAISIGAGLYEEMIFRMILLGLLHTVFVDLFRMPERWGIGVAIGISAVLFALYHPLRTEAGVLDVRRATFFLVAGVFFGILFVVRGFGIAVATHSFYDIAVVLLLADD
ncbi:MAG: CPBP family intramembrane metalloprotease [Planctomycetota bacterium]|nr:CPBP family intramembrane metalloprotease [Planctomycetota bacterium]MDA1262493.1 CPBP family intramembrane metalloprotease [Planctomycetota bacterium]